VAAILLIYARDGVLHHAVIQQHGLQASGIASLSLPVILCACKAGQPFLREENQERTDSFSLEGWQHTAPQLLEGIIQSVLLQDRPSGVATPVPQLLRRVYFAGFKRICKPRLKLRSSISVRECKNFSSLAIRFFIFAVHSFQVKMY
jgi:hypothetical protein